MREKRKKAFKGNYSSQQGNLMIPRGPFDVVHMSSNQMGGHSAKKLFMI